MNEPCTHKNVRKENDIDKLNEMIEKIAYYRGRIDQIKEIREWLVDVNELGVCAKMDDMLIEKGVVVSEE